VDDRDAELHAGIIAGKEEAVAEFEQRYREPFIARGVRKGLSTEDAEDAYQEVFLSTIERAATLEGPLGLSLRKYASTAMRYRIAEYHRGRPSEASLDELAERNKDSSVGARPAPPGNASEEIRAAVRRCLDGLRESYRVILELLFYDQVPADSVADSLGVARNTVYQTKGRALEQIRPCLEEALRAG
jgi:RNA polymerase sigma factor (sigma-70 family)